MAITETSNIENDSSIEVGSFEAIEAIFDDTSVRVNNDIEKFGEIALVVPNTRKLLFSSTERVKIEAQGWNIDYAGSGTGSDQTFVFLEQRDE